MNYDSHGYALAMRVLQSDLYHRLDDRERAECDELIARGQHSSAKCGTANGDCDSPASCGAAGECLTPHREGGEA